MGTRQEAVDAGCKAIRICQPEVATKHTGYLVGGTSPFGTRKAMRVCTERTILELPVMYINGGHRGFLVSLDPKDAAAVLEPTLVEVGYAK